jgi:hypothetical protein
VALLAAFRRRLGLRRFRHQNPISLTSKLHAHRRTSRRRSRIPHVGKFGMRSLPQFARTRVEPETTCDFNHQIDPQGRSDRCFVLGGLIEAPASGPGRSFAETAGSCLMPSIIRLRL